MAFYCLKNTSEIHQICIYMKDLKRPKLTFYKVILLLAKIKITFQIKVLGHLYIIFFISRMVYDYLCLNLLLIYYFFVQNIVPKKLMIKYVMILKLKKISLVTNFKILIFDYIRYYNIYLVYHIDISYKYLILIL